jgi:Domain of unknown function (DUF5069)
MAIFQWAYAHGRKPSEKEVEVWNDFMQRRGWRDESSGRLRERVLESGIEDRVVQTFFDYLEADEGRPARFPDDPTPPSEPVGGGDRIPGLRSPRDKVGGICHFGRMLDKIRLFHEGKLPQGWIEAKGSPKGFDGTCCEFLKIDYEALEAETVKGRGDDQMLQWTFANGRQPTNEEVEIWNDYLSKRGWRDQYTPRLHIRLQEAGLPVGTVLTMFDFVDLDEGRTPGSR